MGSIPSRGLMKIQTTDKLPVATRTDLYINTRALYMVKGHPGLWMRGYGTGKASIEAKLANRNDRPLRIRLQRATVFYDYLKKLGIVSDKA